MESIDGKTNNSRVSGKPSSITAEQLVGRYGTVHTGEDAGGGWWSWAVPPLRAGRATVELPEFGRLQGHARRGDPLADAAHPAVLRSKTPDLVEQQMWSLLLARYAIRGLRRRLGQSLSQDSPPQTRLFKLYHQIYGDSMHDLPTLLPEVWRLWDPITVKARGKDALVQFRMDFLILAPAGARIVLEVDGQTHYARETHVGPDQERRWYADPARYAHTMAQSRDLILAGYEVYRFGAHDLQDEDKARATLGAFFDSLFRKHRVVVPRRPS